MIITSNHSLDFNYGLLEMIWERRLFARVVERVDKKKEFFSRFNFSPSVVYPQDVPEEVPRRCTRE